MNRPWPTISSLLRAAAGAGAAASSSAGPAKRRRIEGDENYEAGIGASDEPQNCPWQGSYGDLLSKHVAECPNWAVSCPRECGQTMPRRALKQHETTCTRMAVTCKICGEAMRPEELGAHKVANSELHATLLEIKCGDLEEENAEVRRQNADLRRGQSSLLNSVTWLFKKSDITATKSPRLVSDPFHLCGVGPLIATISTASGGINDGSVTICLFHAGHVKDSAGGASPCLAGEDVCDDQWAGTFTASISDRSDHSYKTVTDVSMRVARKNNDCQIIYIPSEKLEAEDLMLRIQAVSIGPVIENTTEEPNVRKLAWA